MAEETGYFRIKKKKKIKLLTPQYIYAKYILIYAFCYTAAFAVGCLLFHALREKSSAVIDVRISAYFSVDFSGCNDAFDYAKLIFAQSGQDIAQLLLIFCAGFTMFASLAVAGVLLFRGLSFGFSVSYLTFAIRSETIVLERPVSAIVIFSILCAVSAAVLIHTGVKTTLFSDDFKALCGRPRLIIKSKALYLQLFRFLIALGAILILNLIRCVL